MTNGSVTLISDPLPRIATTLDHMRAVYQMIREEAKRDPSKRMLTRLHVHTLAYQAILVTKGKRDPSKRMLTHLHVHTLAYQAILVTKGMIRFGFHG